MRHTNTGFSGRMRRRVSRGGRSPATCCIGWTDDMTQTPNASAGRQMQMARRCICVLLLGTALSVLPRAVLGQPADPMEGRVVRAIQVTGLRNLSPDFVERHLATHAGEPFRTANLKTDQRRLDELRLFS